MSRPSRVVQDGQTNKVGQLASEVVVALAVLRPREKALLRTQTTDSGLVWILSSRSIVPV